MFANRKLLIATKHHKEKVIAPILEKELGVHCFVDPTFDTDTLGTFTGEVERNLDPIATAREKCLRAMQQNQCDLGIASEGSFGPHPTMFFVNADDEFVIFIDLKNNVEVISREISTSTNFDAKLIQTQKELLEFAEQIGFPSHALILRKKKDDFTEIHKGIVEMEMLKTSFDYFFNTYGSVYAETDMRAMHNPTRMEVIEKATKKLVQKIKSSCPNCNMPGFGITDAKTGLECSLCGLPTKSIKSHILKCQHCQYIQEDMYPYKKTHEEPTFCDYCNP